MTLLLLCAHLMLLPTGRAADAAALLIEADLALARIDYAAAEMALHEALAAKPRDPDVHWRLARVHVLQAEVQRGPDRNRHLGEAEAHAREAIARDSSDGSAYTWLAAALGYRALTASTAHQIALVQELLDATERAIALNPLDDIAHSIRGSTFRALGRTGWLERGIAGLLYGSVPSGGFAEAEPSLREAVRLAPGVMRHRYELAVLLLDTDREAEARRLLEEAAALPVRIASDVPRLETIRELLALEHPTSPDPDEPREGQ